MWDAAKNSIRFLLMTNLACKKIANNVFKDKVDFNTRKHKDFELTFTCNNINEYTGHSEAIHNTVLVGHPCYYLKRER